MRIWDTLPGDGHGELKRVMFPKAERGFLSRVIYVPAVRLYFAAALDMTIKVYDGDFQLQQSVPSGGWRISPSPTHSPYESDQSSWRAGQRSVLCLSFDAPSRELISAGIDGVKIWMFDRSRLRSKGRRGPMKVSVSVSVSLPFSLCLSLPLSASLCLSLPPPPPPSPRPSLFIYKLSKYLSTSDSPGVAYEGRGLLPRGAASHRQVQTNAVLAQQA